MFHVLDGRIAWGVGAALAAGLAMSCGGAGEEPRAPGDDEVPEPYDDGDLARAGEDTPGSEEGDEEADLEEGDLEEGDLEVADDAKEKEEPPVTFALENTHPERDLVFSLDRGWQPVLFAFSGEPPDAEPIVMFPKHCTAACDAEPEERCPECPEPTDLQDIKDAQERKEVPPGEAHEVSWDEEIYLYEDAEGTRDGRAVTCECYEKEPVPEETYTIRACGFRVTEEPNEPSVYQCEDGEMEVPADEPIRVELEFPEPDEDDARIGGS